MSRSILQGPIRAVDVLDILAWEDTKARDAAMASGQHETGAYYRAWRWLTAVVLDNPRPSLDFAAERALHRVQGVGFPAFQHRLESNR